MHSWLKAVSTNQVEIDAELKAVTDLICQKLGIVEKDVFLTRERLSGEVKLNFRFGKNPPADGHGQKAISNINSLVGSDKVKISDKADMMSNITRTLTIRYSDLSVLKSGLKLLVDAPTKQHVANSMARC